MGSNMFGFLYVIMVLLFMIGLFYLIVKWMAKRNRTFSTGRAVKSLGGVPLGPNKSIQVVEIGNALFVIGVGENISLLGKIEDPEEIEMLKERLALPSAFSFDGLAPLGGWLRGLKQRSLKDETAEAADSPSFQQLFQEKMQRLADRKKNVEQLLNEEITQDRLNDS